MRALLAGPLALICSVAVADESTTTVAKPKPVITISAETTRITGPLDDEGYVDYVAALNQSMSKGVTTENNAVVLLWQALGPAEVSEEIREPFFEMLGIDAPPEKGEYFVTFWKFSETLHEENDDNGDGPDVNWEELSRRQDRARPDAGC